MIISIDAEKACDKVQHLLMIKNTQQSGSRGSISQHDKGCIQETYNQHHTQWAKTESFPRKTKNKTRVSAFTTSIQHSIGSSSHPIQTRKRNKRHPNWKGGSKTVIVCRWHDSVERKSCRLHQKTIRPCKWIWQEWDTKSIFRN